MGNQRELPFRLIAVVQHREAVRYTIAKAAQHPEVGFGLMLRDPEHREEKVRALAGELPAGELPENIRLISNGCNVPGIEWRHMTVADLRGGLMPFGSSPSLRRFGCSVHSLQELATANLLHPDYLLLSPIFPTESKPGVPHLGIERLASFIAATPRPVIALGGITTAGQAAECLAAGAWGIAGITLFQPENEEALESVLTVFSSS